MAARRWQVSRVPGILAGMVALSACLPVAALGSSGESSRPAPEVGAAVSVDGVGEGPAEAGRTAEDCERRIAALVGSRPIEFDAGRATVRQGSRDVLDRIAFELAACPGAIVAVAGHTDSDGTDESNLDLSLARARTVVDMLVADGIPPHRLTAIGYGESRPLTSNASEAGKAINRRIEFVLGD